MNVLLVTRPLAYPWNEGSKNLAYNLAKNLRDHNVHILVRKNFNERIGKNVILHKIYPNKHKHNVSYIEKLKLFFFLLMVKDIDVYHFIYTPENYSSVINNLLMKIKSRKSIQTIPTKLKKISNKLFFADNVVAISDFTKNLLLKHKINNVIKINTGIDTNHFKPFERKELIKKYNVKNKFVMLFPIDLEKGRGSRVILKIIRDISNLKNVLFIVSYRSTKKAILEERYLKSILIKLGLSRKVMFIKDPKDVRDLINISNVVIYPIVNHYEKHEIPMILLECMSMEKPIIINDTPPMNEIIKENEGIKVNDYFEFKEIIIKLIKNKNFSKETGKLARKRIIEDFNIAKTAKSYSILYDKLGCF